MVSRGWGKELAGEAAAVTATVPEPAQCSSRWIHGNAKHRERNRGGSLPCSLQGRVPREPVTGIQPSSPWRKSPAPAGGPDAPARRCRTSTNPRIRLRSGASIRHAWTTLGIGALPPRAASLHCSVRHEGACLQQMEVLSVEWTVHHGSDPDGWCGRLPRSKLRGQQAASGGPAKPQAATRVNPEQASRVTSRTPTRLRNGEGRRVLVRQPSTASSTVRRGSGSGMWGRSHGQRGRPGKVRARRSQRPLGGRPDRESDGLVVPTKPINAGGGKGPDFWSASARDPEGRLA
jgi:hypothetical protein